MKIELRTNKAQLRSTEDGILKVSGYVNKTNEPSEVLGVSKKFIEKISKGAFSQAISNAKEIDFLAEHNPDKLLSSTRNGSLKLKEDSNGLWIDAEITPTSYGKDTYELIKSGIFKNMSFGFRAIKDSWKSIEDGLFERTIHELELFEVSVVKNPAYSQSTISARNIEVKNADEVIKNIKLEKEDVKMKRTYYPTMREKMNAEQEQRNNDYQDFKDFLNEERTLQMTSQGTSLVPESVEKSIVLSIEHSSPLFENAYKIPTQSGSLKIAVETENPTQAGFVGENVAVKELAISMEEVKLEQKRVGAAINLTNQLLNDAGVDIVEYCSDLLGRRVAKIIEKSMFVGDGGDEFNGIVNNSKVPTIDSKGAVTYDTLVDLYNAVHPEFHKDVAFYMSPVMYKNISKLKDNNGHFYIQNGIVNGKPTRTLFGAPVHITVALEDATSQVICCNAEVALAVMIKQASGLQLIVDSENALKGIKTLLFDMYLDSAVVNHQAIAKLI